MSPSIYEGVMLRRTASAMEHRNEKPNASKMYAISSTTSEFMFPMFDGVKLSALHACVELTVVNNNVKAYFNFFGDDMSFCKIHQHPVL